MLGSYAWPLSNKPVHLLRATPTATRAYRVYWSSPSTRDTRTKCRAFGSGAVTTCFTSRSVATGDRTPIYSIRMRGERSTSTPLLHVFQIQVQFCVIMSVNTISDRIKWNVKRIEQCQLVVPKECSQGRSTSSI